MPKTVNILGDTPKQQWLGAINLMEFAITSNVSMAHGKLYEIADGKCDEVLACLDNAKKQIKLFADEMRMLVEGVFDE